MLKLFLGNFQVQRDFPSCLLSCFSMKTENGPSLLSEHLCCLNCIRHVWSSYVLLSSSESMWSLQTSSTWKLGRNANSWAHSRSTESETLGAGSSDLYFYKLSWWHWCVFELENLWSLNGTSERLWTPGRQGPCPPQIFLSLVSIFEHSGYS